MTCVWCKGVVFFGHDKKNRPWSFLRIRRATQALKLERQWKLGMSLILYAYMYLRPSDISLILCVNVFETPGISIDEMNGIIYCDMWFIYILRATFLAPFQGLDL